ncbi:hypothetical protein ACOME3_008038 [Neoechinorhynchus agilis]
MASGTEDQLSAKIARFHQLKRRNVDAVRRNHKAVIEEDRLSKLPRNHERKQERLENRKQMEEKKKEAEDAGIDFERLRNLDYSAEECDRWNRRLKRNARNDQSCDFEDYTMRQYHGYTKKCRTSIDMEQYELMKSKMRSTDFYPSADNLNHWTHRPKKEDIDRLTNELNKQAMRRVKSLVRRRGITNINGDIDYINEKNRVFNETVERFYGTYTAEIKQNLERGTAV